MPELGEDKLKAPLEEISSLALLHGSSIHTISPKSPCALHGCVGGGDTQQPPRRGGTFLGELQYRLF